MERRNGLRRVVRGTVGRGVEALERRTLMFAGDLDTAFGGGDGIVVTNFPGPGGVGPTEDSAYRIAAFPDGGFILMGERTDRIALARYHADGSLDESFGRDEVTDGDDGPGRMLVAGVTVSPFVLRRGDVAAAGDGKIVVAGQGGAGDMAVTRLNPDGTPDVSFGRDADTGASDGDGVATVDFGGVDDSGAPAADYANAVAVLPDGKVLVAGGARVVFGDTPSADVGLARFNADGSLDTTFGRGGVDGDGKVTTDYQQGSSFGGYDYARAIAVQRDGRVVLAGSAADGFFEARLGESVALVRYTADGAPDSSFGGGDGVSGAAFGPDLESANDVAVTADGKLLVSGGSGTILPRGPRDDFDTATFDPHVVRYNADGSVDRAFGVDGRILTAGSSNFRPVAVAALPGGKVLVGGDVDAGNSGDLAVARYNADGTPDPGFGPGGLAVTELGGSSLAGGMAVLADGKAVLAGHVNQGPDESDFVAVRHLGDAPPAGPDGDDQVVEAVRTRVGERVRRSIDAAGDVDVYAFDVAAGQRVSFNVDRRAGSNVDSYLRLFDSGGRPLAANDNGPTPAEPASPSAYLEYTFTARGTFYAGVSASPNRVYDAGGGGGDVSGRTAGAYALELRDVPFPDGDDQLAEAAELRAGEKARKSIAFPTDVDLFRFEAGAGQRVALNVDRTGGSRLDSLLRLFDAAGNELAVNDNGPAPGEAASPSAYLEFHALTAGSYFVGVSAAGNRAYDPRGGGGDAAGNGTGGYTLRMSGGGGG